MNSMNAHHPSTWPRRRMLALGAAAALLALSGLATARAESGPLQVDVLDRESNETLQVWRDHGRPVVAGRPGARYAVLLRNVTGERVLAVVAIDGVNVISGETASVEQRGYVLGPWESTYVTGWRKSDDEVAAFKFTALSDSYAARTGRPLDVGVIGVAVFREAAPTLDISDQIPAVPRTDRRAKSLSPPSAAPEPQGGLGGAATAAAPPAMQPADRAEADGRRAELSRAPAERLGTGHGPRESSVVRTTTFQRASGQPAQQVEIRYDSLPNLVAAGIVPPPRVAATRPRSFPADPSGYVPDPR